jgi:rod shape-determining protein MreC
LKHNRKSARAIALTIKPLASGLAVIVLVLLSLSILMLGRNRNGIIEDARMAVTDTLAPVMQVLASPMESFSSAGAWVHDMVLLREENLKLKTDNARLMRWQSAATELSSENERLHTLLNFAPIAHTAYISARVAMDGSNLYSHSVVIGAGLEQGVEEDSAVVNENGLVGRIISLGQKTSRVLLLTDMNSRIPVIAQSSREHAIAGGTGKDTLSLFYLPESSKIKVGEKIVTSGDGAVLPPGLPVGVVTKIEKGVATIQAFADWKRLEYVSVMDYSK